MKIEANNFLKILGNNKEEKRKKRFFTSLKFVLYSFLVLVSISLFLLIFHFWAINDVYKLSKEGKASLQMAAEEVKDLDFNEADFYLEEAEENFNEARVRFSNLEFSKRIPWIKYQYGAISNMLDAGVGTITALRDLVNIVDDILGSNMEALMILERISSEEKRSFFDISAQEKRDFLERIEKARPGLELVREKIDLAFYSLDEIRDDKVIGKIMDSVEPMREALLELQSTVNKAIPIAQILPRLAGYPEKKTYLFLLQNNDELRPTGGFIGTYGIISVENGEIKTFDTDNVYALDGAANNSLNIAPPPVLKKYLSINKWFFRDSNWSPSFPDAAKKAKWFYYTEGGEEKGVDTVIAITPTFIENILHQIGDIRFDNEVFTADNLMEVLQYKVEKEYYERGIPEVNRKDIVGDIADEIFKRMGSLPAASWPQIIKVIEESLDRKDILIWSEDTYLQTLVLKEGWGGEIKETRGDYLMVVDANLASYKTDGVTDKNISYSFSKEDDGRVKAKVEIKYKNNGSFTWKTTRYRTYTRVYVPRGSTLIRGTGMMENDKTIDPSRRLGKVDVVDDLGKTYFGAFISIEPGEERALVFEYFLPARISNDIENNSYTLFVQRQPGSVIDSLTLALDFDKNIKYAKPSEDRGEWGNDTYKLRTDLEIDRFFEVGFSK